MHEDALTSPADPTTNGEAPVAGRDAAIIAAIEEASASLRERAKALRAELDQIAPELRRYDKAIKALRDEPLRQDRAPAKPKKPQGGTAIGDDRLAGVRDAILQISATRDEFRQVDVRQITGGTSSVSATAFERLRQDGVIRLARKDGNNKYYRLTPEGLALRASLADDR